MSARPVTRAWDRLARVAPASAELLKRAGERGAHLGTINDALMRLLDRDGALRLSSIRTCPF